MKVDRIPLLLLAGLICVLSGVDAKGGGSSSSSSSSGGKGSSKSSSKSSSGSSGSSGSTIVVINGHNKPTRCVDSVTSQTVPCPGNKAANKKKSMILGITSGIVGFALIVGLVAAIWKRPTCCRRKKKHSEPRSAAPTSAKSAWNQGYRELGEPKDDADRGTENQNQKDLERGKV